MTQQTIDTTASPVVPQATGLAAFELNVSATPLVITFDVDALNAAVDAILAGYEGREVEEDDIAAIKSEMAGLNKIRERIESARKDIAGRISAPVKEFEAQVKAAAQRITDVRAKLDEQVKYFEEKQRQARRAGVQDIITDVLTSAALKDFTVPFDDRWLNKSIATKTIRAEVESIVLKEKTARLQAEQLARAKQDRMKWLEQAVKAACASYGFELPLASFSAFLSLDASMEEAQEAIAAAFTGEQERQRKVATPPPAPVSEGMPTADDDNAMPTVESRGSMPSVRSVERIARREMTVHVSCRPELFHSVMDLLRQMGAMAIVTVNGNPLPRS